MVEALIPAYGGVLSAFGMLASPPARVLSKDLRCPLDKEGLRRAQGTHGDLTGEGLAALDAKAGQAALESTLALQYAGQGYALEVPFDPSLATLEGLRETFEAAHDARYGYRLGKAVSMVRLRLTVRTAPALNGDLPDASGEKVTSSLTPWPVEGHGDVQRVARSGLQAGDEIRGPAIIQESTATHWLAVGWRAECQRGGHLRLRKILLNLRFLVDHVLTNHGIELFKLELVRRVLLILIRRVVVARTGGRHQLNLVTHGVSP